MNTIKGRYGSFGGRYSPEVLMGTLTSLEAAFDEAMADPGFMAEYQRILMNYSCRPTPLYFAENLTRELKGGKVYLKREDLNHTGSHKINNVIGQALLARRMGKKKVIAETGAGQHGVATATAAALMGLSCMVFMGREDTQRQALNVARMEMLGATVVPVDSGTGTLKDATNEAMRYWASCTDDTFYVIGSVVGPHPYPAMVTAFQRIIGDEVRARMLELEGRLPTHCIACVGGGSNAIGLFTAFLEDKEVQLMGVEAAGEGLETGRHAASITRGSTGILHGMKSLLLQDAFGQVLPAHSISAGLDYPGVGPQHAHLHATGRARYETATDADALEALLLLTRLEGIIPAMESAHAVACAMRVVPETCPDDIIVINLSGRGEKDIERVARIIKEVQS